MSHILRNIDNKSREVVEKFTASLPIKLGEMARELGIKVKVASMDSGISGQILKNDEGYVIRVNRNEARERQRFTIAHEISHFLLHRHLIDNIPGGITDNVLYRSGAPEKIEYEANRLAAELVMPRHLIEVHLRSDFAGIVSDGAVENLAERFEVSKAAMEIRLSVYKNSR